MMMVILIFDSQIVLDGFLPKPGADYSSTSSSAPDKTFLYVNNRPVQLKEITKVGRRDENKIMRIYQVFFQFLFD